MAYLLKDSYANHDRWFEEITPGIGPRLTLEKEKAMRFETKEEALMHPACRNYPLAGLLPDRLD